MSLAGQGGQRRGHRPRSVGWQLPLSGGCAVARRGSPENGKGLWGCGGDAGKVLMQWGPAGYAQLGARSPHSVQLLFVTFAEFI